MEKSEDKMVRKRRHLTPEDKYQIFLEATMAKAKGNGSISEVLRRWGIHSSDLTRIRAAVEVGAVTVFKERKSRRPKVNLEQYEQLKTEKERHDRSHFPDSRIDRRGRRCRGAGLRAVEVGDAAAVGRRRVTRQGRREHRRRAAQPGEHLGG